MKLQTIRYMLFRLKLINNLKVYHLYEVRVGTSTFVEREINVRFRFLLDVWRDS